LSPASDSSLSGEPASLLPAVPPACARSLSLSLSLTNKILKKQNPHCV